MKKRFTIESGVCPKCASRDINYGIHNFNDSFMTYHGTCDDCGIKFMEEYSINFNGVLIVETDEYFDSGDEIEIESDNK